MSDYSIGPDEIDVDALGNDSLDAPSEPPHPVNWNLLSADDLETEWLELNRWVDWLRKTYGLPASVMVKSFCVVYEIVVIPSRFTAGYAAIAAGLSLIHI